MSTADFAAYVDPDRGRSMTDAGRRFSLTNYPPRYEILTGMWEPLSREPFRGITTDGVVIAGLFDWQPAGAPAEAAASAAVAWLNTLAPEIRAQVSFPVDSHLWRHWQNTPSILRDPQVELGELDMRQREAALNVVRASLSGEGYSRTREVMANNRFLGELINATEVLNEWAFALSIFGSPSSTEPWGWQLFGHHLALNCFFAGSRMALSPVFMGMEPDHDHGQRRRRMFEPHERAALDLMASLGEAERDRAVLHTSMLTRDQPPHRYHPADGRHLGGAFQDNRLIPYEGSCVGSFSAQQKHKVLAIAELFVQTMPDGLGEARLREIEKYLPSTHFAWIGPADDINPFYFRIHSPVALIEFDHHSGILLSNKDPARFHVHSIIRTPNGGDYGADLLRHHYAQGDHGGRSEPGDHGLARLHSHDGGRTMHHHD